MVFELRPILPARAVVHATATPPPGFSGPWHSTAERHQAPPALPLQRDGQRPVELLETYVDLCKIYVECRASYANKDPGKERPSLNTELDGAGTQVNCKTRVNWPKALLAALISSCRERHMLGFRRLSISSMKRPQ